tara:strand:- start:32824 stop:33591 length:768 start_codon:yes stop_codon:yes gene_type:complete
MIDPTDVWVSALHDVSHKYEHVSAPRDLKVREIVNYNYTTSLSCPVVEHKGRNLNYAFMFGEAAWILKGRNDLNYISKYMKTYGRFSDDGVTLNGAYGPKITDQISWAANELKNDPDSRRCYVNIWRERPGVTKDVPCTTGLQFLLRGNALHCVVNMRSQDCVWGMPYDIFTFSAITKYLQLMLYNTYDLCVGLGELHVRAGSFHIYEQHFVDAEHWLSATDRNEMSVEYDKLAAVIAANEYTSNLENGANQLLS